MNEDRDKADGSVDMSTEEKIAKASWVPISYKPYSHSHNHMT